jgi:ubiquinone/menaquinone biosynthesis C-methylase UbiE
MVDYFQTVAKLWDSNQIRVENAKNTASSIINKIDKKSNLEILDIGCGTGLLSVCFVDIASSILAVDNSQSMLDEFNNKISSSDNLNSIKTQKCDITSYDFKDKKFDLIISNMTFHHIKDIESVIEKLSKNLKSGGYLAIADLESEDGDFHGRGNEGVEHFGFDKIDIFNIFSKYFYDATVESIFTITKDVDGVKKDYPIFLVIGRVR